MILRIMISKSDLLWLNKKKNGHMWQDYSPTTKTYWAGVLEAKINLEKI